MVSTIFNISSIRRTVIFGSQSSSNLEFNLTLPTSDKSYLVLLKNKLLNRIFDVSKVGGSPGLNNL